MVIFLVLPRVLSFFCFFAQASSVVLSGDEFILGPLLESISGASFLNYQKEKESGSLRAGSLIEYGSAFELPKDVAARIVFEDGIQGVLSGRARLQLGSSELKLEKVRPPLYLKSGLFQFISHSEKPFELRVFQQPVFLEQGSFLLVVSHNGFQAITLKGRMWVNQKALESGQFTESWNQGKTFKHFTAVATSFQANTYEANPRFGQLSEFMLADEAWNRMDLKFKKIRKIGWRKFTDPVPRSQKEKNLTWGVQESPHPARNRRDQLEHQ